MAIDDLIAKWRKEAEVYSRQTETMRKEVNRLRKQIERERNRHKRAGESFVATLRLYISEKSALQIKLDESTSQRIRLVQQIERMSNTMSAWVTAQEMIQQCYAEAKPLVAEAIRISNEHSGDSGKAGF